MLCIGPEDEAGTVEAASGRGAALAVVLAELSFRSGGNGIAPAGYGIGVMGARLAFAAGRKKHEGKAQRQKEKIPCQSGRAVFCVHVDVLYCKSR